MDTSRTVDLVFEGGGVKGIGLVGALSVLEERGFTAARRAGSSAGSIVAALHAAGYTAEELHRVMLDFDFTRFLDKDWLDRVPLVGVPLSVILELGIFEGQVFERWIADMLAAKDVRTFGDLRIADAGPDPRFQHSLQVVVSDTTAHEMLVLPKDARRKLGLDPDTVSISEAVRASMAIPIYFEPKRVLAPIDGRKHVLVDGGMLSNFPVWVFDSKDREEGTIGLMLVESTPRRGIARGSTDMASLGLRSIPIVDHAIALVETMVQAHDRLYIEQSDFARTIAIETLGVRTTDFGLPVEKRERLYRSGRQAAERFLRSYTPESYGAAFAAGKRRSRRAAVRAAMRSAALPLSRD